MNNGNTHVNITKEKVSKYFKFMNPLNLSKTHTTKFILAMGFDENTKYDKILTSEFKDSYIAIFDDPDHDDKITLVYEEPINEIEFFDTYDIPDKWADDYVKILDGKYSELSEEYKQHLLKFWDLDSKSSLYSVLYKDKSAVRNRTLELEKGIDYSKVNELWPAPNLSSEIYGLGAL